ncbi:C6 transcription factor NosA [Aspergillus costaricaensis CBS 115574]|uniref:C6 transcription factor NosA n=1 Tax=Aspergillus costaricaensis CBS 115574 TaxID=1448317 RepID=A0ACD1IDF7_9EURO|nr:C6 transcription factor NosA [Aspergillus costaricaensis CBS 115574]RAK88396.1 C6 transcription factor NosA [Aspergillus costaricaensis CBS 115574]
MPAAAKKRSTPVRISPVKSEECSQSPSASEGTSTGSSDKNQLKLHKRSRSGCFTCRLRRKKCDEKHPSCGACVNLCVKCEYKRPIWWGNAEQRRIQKERIKNKIKQTKMHERNGALTDSAARTRSMAVPSPTSPEYEFGRPAFPEQYDIFASHLPTPAMNQPIYAPTHPYEIDVKTERHTFVNDVPLRHDSCSSTFSTFAPPQLNAPLPTFPSEDWFHDEYFAQVPALPGIDPALCEQSIGQTYAMLQSNIPVSDHDRPLLDHFIHNVLRIIFPVLEAHQRGHLRAQAILQALETNKCYLHCCLSVAAIHLKTTEGLVGEQIDHDIMRNRFEAVSQLCLALGEDTNHEEILDATLAMIFFHCSVGPADDYLPDIPWFEHFQAASNLVHRLGLPTAVPACGNPYMLPPFTMTLASWIDILGSTMHGKTPEFAHTYRAKHLSGSSLGLRELMGCDDRVMYLISEITCLDALKRDGRIDEMGVCSHVSALGQQLEFTEPVNQTLESPFLPNGAFSPEILTKNITAAFRLAARIYLCSLVPGFDRNQPSTVNLVAAVANVLYVIPSGPEGFDRSLVWPILIAGAYSAPDSHFRTVLADRAAALGEHAELGSFGRMYRVLKEVWRVSDESIEPVEPVETVEPVESASAPEERRSSSASSSSDAPVKAEGSESPKESLVPWGAKEMKKPFLHWREIMQQNGWDYLLL